MTPIATNEAATARWLKIGFREKVGRISDMAPAAARKTIQVGAREVDVGEVLVQERRAALAGVEEDAPSKWRSISSIVRAAIIIGPVTTSSQPTAAAHENSGIRRQARFRVRGAGSG